jgi:nucleotide-binding universal stress UspA family protein
MKCRPVEARAMSAEYDTILVPTDGSEGIERVLDHALRLAGDHDATVHALNVVDRRIVRAAEEGSRDEIDDSLRERGERAVDRVESLATEAGVEVVSAVREGVPDREIRAYADAVDADVIVLGTHGRTGRDRLASLGSVTERVVTDTDRPVFVVQVGRS